MAMGCSIKSAKFATAAFAAQSVLAVLISVVMIFAPRGNDTAAMLYPMTAEAQRALPELLSQRDTLIVSRAAWDGAFVIRGARPSFFNALMERGVLVLNASAPGCGPAPQGLIR